MSESAESSETAERKVGHCSVVDFEQVDGVPCPCGTAKRAFAGNADFPGTLHVTEISTDAQKHYHREHAETYFILDCDADAQLELDDELLPIKPRMAIVIPAGVRHRAVGRMTVLIVSVPDFDPADEWFD
ncbi:cupin domain-containing protein [Calycomorphotria hydatis]|uniref:Cupin domain protein n=1 Tax=Calycomorphotria hydatis TaxID=2528027 RepID=A0A517TC76_9PLAN|nr:cupin domain-containing protein [Calycomorphotria hydatis]QDT65973.1 Cupin domain protein [Calycomorphotria hydatis]